MKVIPPMIRSSPTHPLPAILIHDLRTPLSQIIGYSEMMIEQAEDGHCTELVPHLEKIRTAGYRLLELMDNNFRAISTLEIEALAAILKAKVI
jgi:signal transduction histidine kinase